MPPEKCLGPVDPATVEKVEEDEDEKPKDIHGIPPIHQVINIDDFEVLIPLKSKRLIDRKYLREMPVLELGRIILRQPMTNFVLS